MVGDLLKPLGQGVLAKYPVLMQAIEQPKDAVAFDLLFKC